MDYWVLRLDARGEPIWQKTFGGSGEDFIVGMDATPDGGAVFTGFTNSFGAIDHEPLDIKLDAYGNIEWQHTSRVNGRAFAGSIQRTTDGGYIHAGQTDPCLTNCIDGQVIKLDAAGNIMWQKTYSLGATNDGWNAVRQTNDGGYVLEGVTLSVGAGGQDIWVTRLDADGNIIWQHTYGGPNNEGPSNAGLWQLTDGGFIIAVTTSSFGAGGSDLWLIRLDASGSVVWEKTFGGAGDDGGRAVEQTSDGGFIVGGTTSSFATIGHDLWLLRLTADGSIIWQKTYDSGADDEEVHDVRQTADGGFIVAGGGDFLPGVHRFFVLKLNADGTISPSCPPSVGAGSAATPSASSAVVVNPTATLQGYGATMLTPAVTSANTSATVQTVCSNS